MTLAELNLLTSERAQAQLLRCCGAKRWARLMAEKRPFAGTDVLSAMAERLWWSLEAADWLEAFAAHPRIGEHAASAWAAEEQSGAASTSDAIRARLAQANHAYEQRFGYTFIVCASGHTAPELLAALDRRLSAEPADELQVAAVEQRKITGLRLEKLLSP